MSYWINLSNGLKSSLIITAFLIVGTMILGLRVKKLSASDVPTGITLVSVMFVEMVNNMISDMYKKNWRKHAPLLLTILLYLLFANTIALVGLTAPLSNIMVALSFSVFAFLAIQIVGFTSQHPGKRALSMLNPLTLVGEISTPLAMGLRLFGNLLSGSIIGLIIFRGSYELSMAVFNSLDIVGLNVLGFTVSQSLGIAMGTFIHAIFDVFFGAIQAYVYFMLFSIFMSLATEE